MQTITVPVLKAEVLHEQQQLFVVFYVSSVTEAAVSVPNDFVLFDREIVFYPALTQQHAVGRCCSTQAYKRYNYINKK